MSLNDSLKDFPTHQGTVAGALVIIVSAGLAEVGRLVFMSIPLPDAFWYFYGSLAGINVASLGVKRFSDYGREAIKRGADIQDVVAANQITATGTYPVPTEPAPSMPSEVAPAKPSALVQRLASTSGEHPVEPSIRDALKGYADKQKDAADKDDEGII